MSTILGLIGSPRKLGNSELLVKHIARNVPGEHKLDLIRLTEMNLKPCRGCYNCLYRGGQCVMDDDAHLVFDAVLAADAVIVAGPTYFLGAYAAAKLLADRCNMILPRARQTDGKPALALTLAGVPGRQGRAPADLAGVVMALGLKLKGQATFFAALPGEVLLNRECQGDADRMARALFDPEAEPGCSELPCCPVCGSNSFAFIDSGLKCLVCQGKGHVEAVGEGGQGWRPRIEPDPEAFLTGLNWRLEHTEWLQGMKTRFIERKSELKAAVLEYRRDGSWPLRKRNSDD